MHFSIRTAVLGAVAALGFSAGTAKAADLDEIAAFALNICDAVNATGITISSADHCMKFSGEFSYEKHFRWYDDGSFESDGYTSLDLLIEVMGDSDFGVTRGWLDLEFCLDSENCYDVLGRQTEFLAIDEIGISIGNTTVLATGSGATIFNDDDGETVTHLITNEVFGATGPTGGVYVSLTHDLGNGWSIAKAIECIDSCSPIALLGVVSYDKDGVTGHLTVLSYAAGPFYIETIHGGITAELDAFTVQGAFHWREGGYWEVNASILATLETVELAGGFYLDADGDWEAIFSLQFDAGDFKIAKAFALEDDGDWQFEAELSTDLSDNLAFSADFSLDNFGGWEVGKELEWAPGGGYEASTRAWFRSDGMGDRFGIDSEVTLEF